MRRLLALARVMAVLCATGCFGGVFADDYRTCASDLDCRDGERCLNTSTGAVCVTASDSRCSSNAACPGGTACAADGACRSTCDASRSLPCLHGQACKDAVCVGDDARHDPAAAGGLGGVGGAGTAGAGVAGAAGATAGMGGGAGMAGAKAGSAGAQAGAGGLGGGPGGGAGAQGGAAGASGAAGESGSGNAGQAGQGGFGGSAPTCGPGFVCDENTALDTTAGLLWRRSTETGAAWPVANGACGAKYGAGWRLPTLTELRTILDYKATPAPLLDKVTFPQTPAEGFWTADTNGTSGWAWYLSFANGYEAYISPTTLLPFRCVK